MRLRHLWTVSLLFLTLSVGCGYKSKMEDMTTQVADLQAQVTQLESDIHYTCAMTGEMLSGGLMFYLGEGYWVNKMTGSTSQSPELTEACLEAVHAFQGAVDARKDALTEAKAAEAEDSDGDTDDEPPVQVE